MKITTVETTVPKTATQAAAEPLAMSSAEMDSLSLSGFGEPVKTEAYQLDSQHMIKTLGGGEPTPTPQPNSVVSERFLQHKQRLDQMAGGGETAPLENTEPRQYVHHMQFTPEPLEPQPGAGSDSFADPFGQQPLTPQPYPDEPEVFTLDGDQPRPMDDSGNINSSLNMTTAQMASEGLWDDLYPWLMKKGAILDIGEILYDSQIPFQLKERLLKWVYETNNKISKNCTVPQKLREKWENALTLVLEKHNANHSVGPEGQLIFATGRIAAHGWGSYSENKEDRDKCQMKIQEEIQRFKQEEAEKEAAKKAKEAEQAKKAA